METKERILILDKVLQSLKKEKREKQLQLFCLVFSILVIIFFPSDLGVGIILPIMYFVGFSFLLISDAVFLYITGEREILQLLQLAVEKPRMSWKEVHRYFLDKNGGLVMVHIHLKYFLGEEYRPRDPVDLTCLLFSEANTLSEKERKKYLKKIKKLYKYF